MSPPAADRPPLWLRLLVRALPSAFREEFGDQIETVAVERMRRGDANALAEGIDLARTLGREWIVEARHSVGSMGTGGWEPMNTLLQDVRYAFRMLIKTPVVSLVAAVSLALGIAATASALSLYEAFMLSKVSWDKGDSVVRVSMSSAQFGSNTGGVTPASYLAFQAGDELFESLSWLTTDVTNLVEADLDPAQVQVLGVGAGYHEVAGGVPRLGRGLAPSDFDVGAEPVVLLSWDLFSRRYGEDPGVIGRTVQLGGVRRTVVGVLPEEYELLPANMDVVLPENLAGRADDHRRALMVLGIPRDGVTPERIEAELRGIQAGVAPADPEAYEGWDVGVLPLTESMIGREDRLLVTILVAVSLFGLLIACANVANLLLGRAEERQREVSVRTALGAGRGRIFRQLLTESVLLASIGGMIGLGVSIFVIDWFGLSLPAEIPPSMAPRLTPFVFAVSAGISLLAGVVFGLAPAMHAVKADLRDALAGARGGTAGKRRQRVRNAFVIAEFAVAVGLLTGATMLVQAMQTMFGGDPGFRAEGVTTFALQPLEDRYPDAAELDRLRSEVIAALEARPEIASAAASNQLPRAPWGAARTTSVGVVGREEAPQENAPSAVWVAASEDFLDTWEIPLVEGRWLTEADAAGGEPVAVVTRQFAQQFFPDEAALGRSIVLDRDEGEAGEPASPRRIVGVVEDAALQRLASTQIPGAAAYLPHAQVEMRRTMFGVRASGDGAGMARAIREAVASVDPTLPVGDLKTMERHVEEQLAGPRMIGVFVAGIASIALILAALGIYGVMAHSVVQRTREIGIRMAMGAERGSVIGMVTRGGLKLVLVGMFAGLPLAWAMTRVTLSALGDITEVFPLWQTGGIVTALLASVAIAACLVPAVRAAGIRPSRALAQE